MLPVQITILRLGCALVLGAMVGMERERGERAAGIRTHALVAMGSALIMIVSSFGFADILNYHNVSLDPSRVAAQVVSGIGFIGGGVIMLRKEVVKGLTTAAAVWVVAGIGLACGGGMLLEALAATVLTLLILVGLRPLRKHLHRPQEIQQLRIEATIIEEALLDQFYQVCSDAGATIENVGLRAANRGEKIEIQCSSGDALGLAQAIVALRTIPGIETVQVNVRNPTITRELAHV